MGKITSRFDKGLNDFLLEHRRKKDFTFEFNLQRTARNMIESFSHLGCLIHAGLMFIQIAGHHLKQTLCDRRRSQYLRSFL
ncbi:MAG: hypothetical protein JW932_05420 [Deltaproteobacteria bacterium]|nr:hypothetical protein [Deltaproteobacteria bacterium]